MLYFFFLLSLTSESNKKAFDALTVWLELMQGDGRSVMSLESVVKLQRNVEEEKDGV